MVNQPLLEDFGAALPVDIAASTSEETSDGVTTEMVDPAFESELAHECVDEWEACEAVFPTEEPFLGLGGVVLVTPCDEVVFWGDDGGERPGDEAAVGVVDCLSEGVASCCLGAEIHVAEEELTNERDGWLGCFPGVGGDSVLDAPVIFSDA